MTAHTGKETLRRRLLNGAFPLHRGGFTPARIATLGQLVTFFVTWQLWAPRDTPPTFPVIDGLATIRWGWPLVVVHVLALWRPRVGGPLAMATFVLAVLADQTRLQPECLSLALLTGALPFGVPGMAIARWHLTALWFWSGVNKALSLGWADGDAAFIADALRRPSTRPIVAVAVPVIEMALGVLLALRRAPLVAAGGAAALHLGIFVTLSPLFGDWNSAVWPWNVALAAIGPIVVLRTRRKRGAVEADGPSPARARRASAIIGTAFVVSPVLFYAGRLDTYLAHNLYTGNARSAMLCEPSGACASAPFDTWGALNVPLPPEPRLFRAWFGRICTPGQTLAIDGIRSRLTDPPLRTVSLCPVAGPAAVP